MIPVGMAVSMPLKGQYTDDLDLLGLHQSILAYLEAKRKTDLQAKKLVIEKLDQVINDADDEQKGELLSRYGKEIAELIIRMTGSKSKIVLLRRCQGLS